MDNIEIRVPPLGESVTNATITRWYKKVGEGILENDVVLELETDKVTLEVNAPASGTLAQISFDEGDAVNIGDVLGVIAVGGNIETVVERTFTEELATQLSYEKESKLSSKKGRGSKSNVVEPPYASESSRVTAEPRSTYQGQQPHFVDENIHAGPSVRKRIAEEGLKASDIIPTGRDGRVIKEDLILAEERRDLRLEEERLEKERRDLDHEKRQLMQERRHEDYHFHQRKSDFIDDDSNAILEEIGAPLSERRPMSALRRKIAERLKYAQNTAAILTTFNECDLTAVMQLRKLHQDAFTKKYGVKLGFMSFFVKACVHALKDIPSVNAEIDGDEMVFHKRYDIGIAVASSNGLVVPVLRNADKLALFEIEQEIAAFSEKAKTNKLTISDLTGGTFTISNGGTFGSLCSTPILNPPQSAILGMHKIQERPVAMNGHVVIRPMMYLAVSYDHRIIDGREAVTFLVKIKDFLENPGQVLLGL